MSCFYFAISICQKQPSEIFCASQTSISSNLNSIATVGKHVSTVSMLEQLARRMERKNMNLWDTWNTKRFATSQNSLSKPKQREWVAWKQRDYCIQEQHKARDFTKTSFDKNHEISRIHLLTTHWQANTNTYLKETPTTSRCWLPSVYLHHLKY